MGDLKNPKLIVAKGFLFLLSGATAAALIFAEFPTPKVAAFLAISIWSFCRGASPMEIISAPELWLNYRQ